MSELGLFETATNARTTRMDELDQDFRLNLHNLIRQGKAMIQKNHYKHNVGCLQTLLEETEMKQPKINTQSTLINTV